MKKRKIIFHKYWYQEIFFYLSHEVFGTISGYPLKLCNQYRMKSAVQHSNDDQMLHSLMENKDPRCLDIIYERFGGIMFTMVSRMVKPREQAEDVLQETMVKIWNNLDRFDPSKAKLITWMIQIAKNQSLDYLKSKRAKKEKITDSVDVREDVGQVPMTTVNKDLIDVKKIVDDSFDKRDRQILDMLYFQGYTQKEVSENLNIPLGSVKTRVRITLKELRSVINYG